MIAVDTNVLLRFFEADDNVAQTAAARDVVRSQGSVFINPVVLVEFVWALRASFGLDRKAIHTRLQRILAAPEFVLPFAASIERAVEQYGKGLADFADCMIGELNLAFGCDATMTFDKKAARTPSFRPLRAGA
ncbi:type II toxin-antitoxin system VapC family toxin [Rhodopseudomonas palustris]|uniref:PIN domain-containing protein n=1 Tax=Rhodopseudomonas TaxID=1073 RepID=UPI0021F2980E|nr:type II toxin-antitoxin system VapC family toxin [Rhodopseudomonas palustris]UYO43397.1 type II toxin-antitoxin system VapC family toxin [Rhodopseudomonas palustris]